MECVVNVSEGHPGAVLDAVTSAGGPALLDVHRDGDHNRSVLTLGGPPDVVETAARAVVAAAVAHIDLSGHRGVHPRFGAADVVPFVELDPPLAGTGPAALAARHRFAHWAGRELALPCFLYGPERTLPEVRRQAFRSLPPDAGPPVPHPTAGACAVGARPVLVAYNLWISAPGDAVALARKVATAIRSPEVRALGFAVPGGAQVSCNLLCPGVTGPAQVHDAVAGAVERARGTLLRAELVGLAPAAVVEAVPSHRWAELDLSPERTIEARLEALGTGR